MIKQKIKKSKIKLLNDLYDEQQSLKKSVNKILKNLAKLTPFYNEYIRQRNYLFDIGGQLSKIDKRIKKFERRL